MNKTLPVGKQIAYSIGQLGWATLINIISLELVYFYIPPNSSGIKLFVTQIIFLGIFNIISIIAASGRLWDAITDPLIANLSDRFKHPKGRRIPFMFIGALPAALFCFLMFVPPVSTGISVINVIWLIVMQTLFYLFLTIYVTPFFALLPELGKTPNERLNLSTFISITYALGIIIAAQIPLIADVIKNIFQLKDKVFSIQMAVLFMCFLSTIFMYVPVFLIDEKKYCQSVPSDIPLFTAIKKTFKNPNFVFYVIADFSYFMGLAIINTGILYYITVLLFQPEALVGTLLAIMVIVSFLFYPLVNLLAKKFGKKMLVVFSFLLMSLIFLAIYFLGKMPLPNLLQAYLLILFYALPLSFLGILPNAILSDIAENDALKTGVKQEGMFFAARTLMQKFGQTFGLLVFASLISLGKDVGNDIGIRLSGIVGFILCVVAGVAFLKYNEKKLIEESESLKNKNG
ncbi:MAG TPA: MFS transporter [Spirochaetota bacterium]|nr:MFS transporter [Spirochaetota bacterium]